MNDDFSVVGRMQYTGQYLRCGQRNKVITNATIGVRTGDDSDVARESKEDRQIKMEFTFNDIRANKQDRVRCEEA